MNADKDRKFSHRFTQTDTDKAFKVKKQSFFIIKKSARYLRKSVAKIKQNYAEKT